MRETERSDRGTEDGGERSGEDLPRSRDTIAAAPGPDEARKPRLNRRLLALAGLMVAGLAALGGGVFGLVWVFTRTPDSAQVTAVANAESDRQWRWLAAGKIFPATVGYETSFNTKTQATRVGIAPQEPCAKAFDPALARRLDKQGCVTVLRATYADASHTALDTVGIAVMKSEAAADAVDATMTGTSSGGLLPLSFPGTIAESFTRQARETTGEQASGRYLVFYAAGYADGRKTSEIEPSGSPATGETIVTDMATVLAATLAAPLSASSRPCADQEVRCSP